MNRVTTPAFASPLPLARPATRALGAVLLALLAMVLAGCSTDESELSAWMNEQRSQARPRIQPIKPPSQFTPQPYTGADALDPFNAQKLLQVLRRDTLHSPTQALINAQLERRREPLESYPLDTMAMVGSLSQKGRTIALLRVDKLIYQVGAGNYIGQNYGRITRVTESGIDLVEIVQDASGEWIERPATLQLQEGSGK